MTTFRIRVHEAARNQAVELAEALEWTVLKSEHIDGHADAATGIVLDVDHWELTCTAEDAPEAAEGKLIDPQISRSWSDDSVRLTDWGVPA